MGQTVPSGRVTFVDTVFSCAIINNAWSTIATTKPVITHSKKMIKITGQRFLTKYIKPFSQMALTDTIYTMHTMMDLEKSRIRMSFRNTKIVDPNNKNYAYGWSAKSNNRKYDFDIIINLPLIALWASKLKVPKQHRVLKYILRTVLHELHHVRDHVNGQWISEIDAAQSEKLYLAFYHIMIWHGENYNILGTHS